MTNAHTSETEIKEKKINFVISSYRENQMNNCDMSLNRICINSATVPHTVLSRVLKVT